MNDILERLRMYQRPGNLMEEAADEIERLREELLRFAKFAEDAPNLDYGEDRVLSWIEVSVYRARKLAERGGE